ncbi:glutathione S-transferase C-terminal domain-containing protein [Meridianimarinicoccus aquatilis]|nr:glutathione S-transferase C-terminal domain-containing protein [Fluviibacterium aquatile]
MTRTAKLITLLPSADVDLARWMLAHWGIPFDERPHAPIFHILALRSYGAGRMDSPLLIHEGAKFAGVDRIAAGFDPLAPADRRLVPDANTDPALHGDVMTVQHDLRWNLGMGTVKWAYFHFLKDRALVWPSFTTGVPIWERAFLFCGGFGLVKSRLIDALKLSQASANEALGAVQRGFDLVESRLADGRPHLCGDRLTLADLAFATSGGPMVLANGYGGHLPRLESCPPDVQAVITDLRARPAGRYIQQLYDTYRVI